MTETSILPGAVPSTDSGIDMVPPGTGVEESEGGNRRNLMIIGAILGVVVLAAAAYLLLHKSSAPADNTFVPHAVVSAPSKPAPTKSHHNGGGGTHGGPAKLPKKAKHSTVRDPFSALVLPPVETAGGATSTTTVTAPTTDPSAPPVGTVPTTPVTQPTDGGTTTTTGNGGKTTGAPLWIQLKGVNGQRATFDVGYAHHKFRKFVVEAPKASSQRGTVFDKVFALIGIQNGQATIQIGDDTPFDLATGISHVV